jgi:indole-3-glycerol phosphate synthase
MEDILSEIIANKRKEVDLQKQAISIEQLSEGIGDLLPTRSMKQAIASSPTGIIAEFKRRSPSKGWIKENARPEEIVPVLRLFPFLQMKYFLAVPCGTSAQYAL